MKNFLSKGRELPPLLNKLLRIMKLTVLFMCVGLMQLSASIYGQNTRLTLEMQNRRVIDVLEEIEQQSEFRFAYSSEYIDMYRKVTVNVKQKTIDETLHQLFDEAMVKYVINDRHILLYPQKMESETISGRQQNQVTGTVTDADGNPLAGVSIIIKGTVIGTITDVNGNFSLANVSTDEILVFSFIGYTTQEIPVGSQTSFSVMMNESVTELDDIVVIGYGTIKKRDLTGSISSMREESFNKGIISSVDQMIIGRSAGVRVLQGSSEPGGAVSIQIRGAGSINAGNAPLYVIDGLPIDNTTTTSGTGRDITDNPTPRNPLSNINPNDIESIDILKDASATAIYGARAANGVVLITTKKGSEGKMKVSYHGYAGINTPLFKIDVLEPEEYMQVINDLIDEGGGSIEERVTEIEDGGTDWQDQVLRNAMSTSHSLSFSGGAKNTNYYLSLNYFNQEGVVIESNMKRYDTRLNFNHNFNDKFNIGLNFTTSYTKDDYVAYGTGGNEYSGVLHAARDMDPTLRIHNEDGGYRTSPFLTLDSPLAIAYGQDSYKDRYRTLGTFFSEYAILPGWKVKLNIGADIENERRDSYVSKICKLGEGTGGTASIQTGSQGNYLIEGTSTYNREFRNSSINVLVGMTNQHFMNNTFYGYSAAFPSEVTKTFSMQSGSQDTYGLQSNKSTYSLLSYIGRINYSMMDKYLLTATFRADGSSRFGKNNKFGYFPSFAFAWKIGNEEFIKTLGIFSDLKLRTSWGRTGNQDIGNYQSTLTFAAGPIAIFDHTSYTTYTPARISNPDLKWETNEQINVGLDMGFFNNRLYLSTDYFYKKTFDMLLNVPTPPSTGFSSVLKNVGSIQNKGFDFMINTKNLTGTLRWETTLNLSTIKNEVLNLGDVDEIIYSNSIIRVGEPLFSFYGYNVLGVWQEEDDFSTTTDPVVPGDQKYEDMTDDGAVNTDDRIILGNSFPKLTFGLSNDFSYKGFDLSIFIEGVSGVSMLNYNLRQTFFPTALRRNRVAEPLLNRWTLENPSNVYPSFVNANSQGDKTVNSYLVQDASYIKIRNIRIGYTIPIKAFSVVKRANVYLSGENLYTFTKYDGGDPSINARNNALYLQDDAAYPSSRAVTLGILIDF